MTVDLDRERFVETMKRQAEIGATAGGGLDRIALSDADRRARDWLVDQLAALGLEVRIDAFGNTFGYREGTDPDAGTVLVGSHLDSQPAGGVYDGALGVVAALELLRSLADEGARTDRGIELVNWTNEEGSRFQPAMQGSGVWAGVHDLETEYEKTDATGAVLGEELERIGYRGDVPAAPQRNYEAYLELHVEQGPFLEENGADVGVVTGIPSSTWGSLSFHGEANHAGPTPMHHRRDALVAAADAITGIRRIPGRLDERAVATVGHVDVSPNSINVVPGRVELTWDLRSPDDATVEAGRERVLAEAEAAATREGVEWAYEDRMRLNGVEFSTRCVEAVAEAARARDHDSIRLPSGAAHDALHAARVCDAGMVFAVSEGGISHSEAEYTSWTDCFSAAETLADAVLRLARS